MVTRHVPAIYLSLPEAKRRGNLKPRNSKLLHFALQPPFYKSPGAMLLPCISMFVTNIFNDCLPTSFSHPFYNSIQYLRSRTWEFSFSILSPSLPPFTSITRAEAILLSSQVTSTRFIPSARAFFNTSPSITLP